MRKIVLFFAGAAFLSSLTSLAHAEHSFCDPSLSPTAGRWTLKFGAWAPSTLEPALHIACPDNNTSLRAITGGDLNAFVMHWAAPTPGTGERTLNVSFRIPVLTNDWNHLSVHPAARPPQGPGDPHPEYNYGRMGFEVFYDDVNLGRIAIQMNPLADVGCQGNHLFAWQPVELQANHWYRANARVVRRADGGLTLSGTLKDLEQGAIVIGETAYEAPPECTPVWYGNSEVTGLIGTIGAAGTTQPLETILDDVTAEVESRLGNWPIFRGTAARTGSQAKEATLTGPLTLRWRALHGDPSLQDTNVMIEASPVIHEGVVYVATLWDPNFTSGYDSSVVALDVATGQERWKRPLGTDGIWSTPAVDEEADRLYVAAWDGNVYALARSTGEVLWTRSLAAAGDRSLRASPLAVNGRVYVGTYSGTLSKLYALDAATGAIVAQRNLPGGMYSSPTLGGPGRLIVALSLPDGNSALHSYDISFPSFSAPIWTHALAGDSWSTPAVYSGRIYHRSGRWAQASSEATLYIVDEQSGVDAVPPRALTGSYWSSPAVDDYRVYVVTGDAGHTMLTAFDRAKLLAQDPNPVAWTFSKPGGGSFAASPAVANNYVYLSTDDDGTPPGAFYMLDGISGAEVWSYGVPGGTGSAQASPAVVENTVVFISYDHANQGVYAFYKPAAQCHVLTAAFGRPDAPAIQALWALHHRLVPDWDAPWHQAYLRWYDQAGPKAAAVVKAHPWLATAIRAAADVAARITAQD